MKSTGIVRNLDTLGRVVLPIELRRSLDIGDRDPIEIFVEGRNIVLRKFEPTCIFCGSHKNLVDFNERAVCNSCIQKLRQISD